MADAFIGMTVGVHLKPPAEPSYITGTVIDIHNQTLVLEHIHVPATNTHHQSWSIPSAHMQDLQVLDHASYHPPASSRPPPAPSDPAILSFQRPISEPSVPSGPSTPIIQTPSRDSAAGVVLTPAVTPSRPPTNGNAQASQRNSKQKAFLQAPSHSTRKAKGWRSTPLLEEAVQPGPDTPFPEAARIAKPTQKAKKRSRNAQRDEQNLQSGWATEDATDVQDMVEFDFEANLSKFDKRAVFDEIRNEDLTADEDRLVFHNRVTRPGTYGGKNLHPTEMVLSPPSKAVRDHLDSPPEAELSVGAASRQSHTSRPRPKPAGERTASVTHPERPLSRSLRTVPSQSKPLRSPGLRPAANRSNSSLKGSTVLASPLDPPLRAVSTGQYLEPMSPARLHELEAIVGPSNEALIELSGLAIARAIAQHTSDVTDPARRNSRAAVAPTTTKSGRQQRPVVVVLAGNHRKGARALSAVRHLFGRNHGFLVAFGDFSSPELWYTEARTQLQSLRRHGSKFGIRVDSWQIISAHIKKLGSPPALILDGLLDEEDFGHIDDVQHAIETREIIDWCNRSRAQVLSLNCPSGYDGDTGQTTVVEGEPVAVKPDRVLALGGVLSGVHEAMKAGDRWVLTALDVGLLPAMEAGESIRFGNDEWAVDVQLHEGE